ELLDRCDVVLLLAQEHRRKRVSNHVRCNGETGEPRVPVEQLVHPREREVAQAEPAEEEMLTSIGPHREVVLENSAHVFVERDVALLEALASHVHDTTALAELQVLELDEDDFLATQAAAGQQLAQCDVARGAVLEQRAKEAA